MWRFFLGREIPLEEILIEIRLCRYSLLSLSVIVDGFSSFKNKSYKPASNSSQIPFNIQPRSLQSCGCSLFGSLDNKLTLELIFRDRKSSVPRKADSRPDAIIFSFFFAFVRPSTEQTGDGTFELSPFAFFAFRPLSSDERRRR